MPPPAPAPAPASSPGAQVRLRVSGLGQAVEIAATSSTSVGEVRSRAAEDTGIPAAYLLLIHGGKKMTDDAATLADLGVGDRTRLMLMRTPAYAADRAGIDEVRSVMAELAGLDGDGNGASAPPDPRFVDEAVTRACIRLDGIDTGGSDPLRQTRRAALRRAEDLAARWGAAARSGGGAGGAQA